MMRILLLLPWLALLQAFQLYGQSSSPVYQMNIPAEWPQSLAASANITQALFEQLADDIVDKAKSADVLGEGEGHIVIPRSSAELLNGPSRITEVAFSNAGAYFMVQASFPNKRDAFCYLFNTNSGACEQVLKDVRQWAFSNDDRFLLVTHAHKWSVYQLPDGREIFSRPYAQEYYSNGYVDQQIIPLGNEHFLIRESNDEMGNHAYLYNLQQNAIQHHFDFGEERPHNIMLKGSYLAFTTSQNIARDGHLRLYDLDENKEKLHLKEALFLAWAQHSDKFLFHDLKSREIFEFDLEKKKKTKRIEAQYVGKVSYLHNDSMILVDPQAYSFDEGRIKIYDAQNGKRLREIAGSSSEFVELHAEYFVIKRFSAGEYVPLLLRTQDFKEVMAMERKDKMHLSKSGRYLTLEQDKSNLYSYNRFSIIDLKTSRQLLKFSDRIVPHAFEEEKGIIIHNRDGVLHFYRPGEQEAALMLAVNDEGWLCFDRAGRYDCSRSFADRIYFSCTAYDYNSQAWPVSRYNRQMHQAALWEKVWHPQGKALNAPEMKACQHREITSMGTHLSKSDDLFLWASLEQHEMASVNFVVDSEEGIIDFGNFSGKPVTVHKSEILFQCDVWNESNSALLFSYYADHFGGYLALAPDGYFSQSANFKGRVALSIEGEIYDMLQLFDRFYRPDIIEGMLVNTEFSNRPKNNITRGVQTPPRIELLLLDNGNDRGAKVGALKGNGALALQLKALNEGGGIKALRLQNNGKLIWEFTASDEDADSLVHSLTIAPLPGKNYLELIGLSSDGTESKPIHLIYENAGQEALRKPALHVLSIGINAYQNQNYQLQYCVNDMREFTDSLAAISAALFEKVEVKSLEDADATRENILAALDEISQAARPEDVFVFYFAGHGIALEKNLGSEFYFIAHEVTQMTDPENCALHGISGVELQEKLRSIPATKQISFIDACNSGALAAQFSLRGPKIEKSIAQLSRSTGSAVYASTTSEQYAAEYKEIGHGVFTYVLLDALSGATSSQNCEVTAAGLKQHIDGRIPELIEQLKGNRQYPITFLFGQDFPIGLRCRE